MGARADLPPRDRVYVGPRWRVAHAFGTSLPGWLVVLPRRHVTALVELTPSEAADLGPLLREVSSALCRVTGCEKTYVALFAEAEGFSHVHFHVIPAMPAWTRSCGGRGCSGCSAVTMPRTCRTPRWTRSRPASPRYYPPGCEKLPPDSVTQGD
jgi:diadenosine tetraphosphate (Ap4A) HIT family hydrolase